MMSREVVRAAVEFGAPAWLPYGISVSPQLLASSWPSCEVAIPSSTMVRGSFDAVVRVRDRSMNCAETLTPDGVC